MVSRYKSFSLRVNMTPHAICLACGVMRVDVWLEGVRADRYLDLSCMIACSPEIIPIRILF
jgi:hypothetical protein